MVAGRTAIGLALATAGLATVWSSISQIEYRPAALRWSADGAHPVAARAWAYVHCGSAPTLVQNTPRLQAEDLLHTAAKLDDLEAQREHAVTCARTTALAAEVSPEFDGSSPEQSGDLASIK
jgi:hypothetical protein